nr:MAG TPA: hypothetical protein [Microviridae sp.]
MFSHVRFRVGRDAAPGTDRMVYKRSAGHRPDNKRQKEQERNLGFLRSR